MKKNVYLFQPQYAVEFKEENTYWIPYSAGCVWSYVSQYADISDGFDLKDIIFRRENPDDVIARIDNPAVCGFSCYIWNQQYCLLLAQRIKQLWPNCVIIFGGAQVSGKMLAHKFIDSLVLAEGEYGFLDCLRKIQQGRAPDQIYNRQRLEVLDIPSPYTTGVFDSMIARHPDAAWSMTFETNRGCPYACTFCDWGGTTYSKIKKFSIDRITADLEWAIDKPIGYLYCADANFGIFKERDLEIARIIKRVADISSIDSVNLQYAKNSTEIVFEIAQILGEFSRGITVSVQSMNDSTLETIKRKNLDINDIKKLMRLSEQHTVPTYTEMILGLPNETLETWKQGFDQILEMGQHNHIDIWFAQLLENSELNQTRDQFNITSVVAKDYMPLLNKTDWRDLDEDIELISSTETMSLDDIVEGYMYGWMVLHFHISGYSQIYSRWLRHCQDVSYRDFYDCIYASIKDNQLIDQHYQQLKHDVKTYLSTGKFPRSDQVTAGHTIHARSYSFFYQNKSEIYQHVLLVCNKFWQVPSAVQQLQENFIDDPDQRLPLSLPVDLNIYTNDIGVFNCTVTSKMSKSSTFDFYRLRRQGLIKNKLTFVKE